MCFDVKADSLLLSSEMACDPTLCRAQSLRSSSLPWSWVSQPTCCPGIIHLAGDTLKWTMQSKFEFQPLGCFVPSGLLINQLMMCFGMSSLLYTFSCPNCSSPTPQPTTAGRTPLIGKQMHKRQRYQASGTGALPERGCAALFFKWNTNRVLFPPVVGQVPPSPHEFHRNSASKGVSATWVTFCGTTERKHGRNTKCPVEESWVCLESVVSWVPFHSYIMKGPTRHHPSAQPSPDASRPERAKHCLWFNALL